MAEQQDTERELPASQKRLDEARERGQTPRSRELTTAALLLAGAATLAAVGPHIAQQSLGYLRSALTLTRASAFDPAIALESAAQLAWQGFLPALLVSVQSLAELVKAIAKVLLIGGVVGWLIWHDQQAFIMPLSQSPQAAAAFAGHLITRDFVWMAAVLIAIAAADVPLQLWQHAKGLRMSADELKRESKEAEGDPQIKGKLRARQREAARRRMMSAVPGADVVVTNPTHYAVALSYQGASMRAPRVVAKGTDEVAARIRALAEEHGVPVLEAPPLARALYKHAELEAEIPAPLYNAVAQVLAWVFQLKAMRHGPPPLAPSAIAVPPELDPANEAVAA